MKKWRYLLSGVVIGAVLTASTSAFADQIKSLVGKTVTGEYTVNINGTTISDKAVVVNSKANVPLRAISDSMGARIKVEGKTIFVESGSEDSGTTISSSSTAQEGNPYIGRTKSNLEETKLILINKVISPSEERKTVLTRQLADAKAAKLRGEKAVKSAQENNLSETEKKDAETVKNLATSSIERIQKELDSLNADLEKYNKQLAQVEEALALIP